MLSVFIAITNRVPYLGDAHFLEWVLKNKRHKNRTGKKMKIHMARYAQLAVILAVSKAA